MKFLWVFIYLYGGVLDAVLSTFLKQHTYHKRALYISKMQSLINSIAVFGVTMELLSSSVTFFIATNTSFSKSNGVIQR